MTEGPKDRPMGGPSLIPRGQQSARTAPEGLHVGWRHSVGPTPKEWCCGSSVEKEGQARSLTLPHI